MGSKFKEWRDKPRNNFVKAMQSRKGGPMRDRRERRPGEFDREDMQERMEEGDDDDLAYHHR